MRILLLVLSLTLFGADLSYAAKPDADAAFNRGVKAYSKGETSSAVSAWERAAQDGHAMAAYLLGQLYETGKGVEPSHAKAFSYFLKAAERGNAQAGVVVGRIYLNGDPALKIKPDYKKALESFEIGALQAWPDSQYYLAKMHARGQGTREDHAEGMRWLMLAALKRHVPSILELGRIQFDGDGVEKNRVKGWSYLIVADRIADADSKPMVQAAMEKHKSWMRGGEKEEARKLADEWIAKYIPD